MSIIYDALKKVEKNTGKNASSIEKSQAKGAGKPNPILIYIFVILLTLFSGKMILGLFTRPKIKPLPSPVSPALTPIDKTPIPLEEERIVPPAEPVKTPEPTLALSGIFFQQDKGYALINNQILKVGDTIQGAKVEEINLDKVILEFEGRKITLINSSR